MTASKFHPEADTNSDIHELFPGLHAVEEELSPQGEAETETLTPIDEWDVLLKGLVDPNHPCFERNSVRRQIRAPLLPGS